MMFWTDSKDSPLLNSVWYLWKIIYLSNIKLSLTIREIHMSCVRTDGPQQGSCIRLEHNVPISCHAEANSFHIQEDQTGPDVMLKYADPYRCTVQRKHHSRGRVLITMHHIQAYCTSYSYHYGTKHRCRQFQFLQGVMASGRIFHKWDILHLPLIYIEWSS